MHDHKNRAKSEFVFSVEMLEAVVFYSNLRSIQTKIDSIFLTSNYKSNSLRFLENIRHRFREKGSIEELYQYLQVSSRDCSSSVMVPILSTCLSNLRCGWKRIMFSGNSTYSLNNPLKSVILKKFIETKWVHFSSLNTRSLSMSFPNYLLLT